MSKFFKLICNYFSDKRKSFLHFYKPGKDRILGFWFPTIIFVILFTDCFISVLRRKGFQWSDASNIWFAFLLMIFFFYIAFLACHLIVTEDYIEFVEYVVKRRKIKFNELNNIGMIFKYGAPTLVIESIDSKFIEINLSFFKDEDYRELISYIGEIRDDLKPICEKIRAYGEPKIKRAKGNKHNGQRIKVKNNKKRVDSIKHWMSVVISFALLLDILLIIWGIVPLGARIESLSWLDKISSIRSNFIAIGVLLLGFRLSPRIEEKLTGKSLKFTVITGIMSVISIPLVLLSVALIIRLIQSL